MEPVKATLRPNVALRTGIVLSRIDRVLELLA